MLTDMLIYVTHLSTCAKANACSASTSMWAAVGI